MRFAAILGVMLAWPAGPSRAQVASPNAAGVAMGHVHYHVQDVEAHKKFWATLGATPTRSGTTEVMKLPDILIFLSKGEAYSSTAESVVNHLAFKVPNLGRTLSALAAAGWKVTDTQYRTLTPDQMARAIVAYTYTPERDKIELFQELTELARFTRDGGQDFSVERLNQKLTVPIATHHMHLYVPDGKDGEARDWYVKVFGGVPGTRGGRYKAVDVPGINLNFLGVPAPTASTRGRTLDHIGFEVRNLEAFCKKLEASGVKLDVPYAKAPNGLATASLSDPWGTSIELTEGLSAL